MSQIETQPRGEAPSAATSKRDWTRIALSLVLVTMAYNLVEAGLALWSGISARSVVLIGFGLDSVIECAAAGVLLWGWWWADPLAALAMVPWLIREGREGFEDGCG